ncbi:MAG TPA: hypothetical protein VIT19_12330 [Pyrinomonadaceae bacterium]
MCTLKRLISCSIVAVVLAGTSLAQENRAPIDNPVEPVPATSGPVVTATATSKRVRFVSPGTAVQLRVEVYNEAGQKVFDTELRGGNVLDWHLQDAAGQRLQTGSYACVLTIKSLSGRLSQRVGTVTVNEEKTAISTAAAVPLSLAQQQTIGPVEGNAAFTVLHESDTAAITAVTHDGTEGQVARTRGALSFRMGDFFSGRDKEQMRLTEDGKLGIGTNNPQSTLDVAGTIRAERILIAKPKLGSFSQMSGADTAQAEAGGSIAMATGSGTQDQIAKWIDNAGTLGDSGITETGGNVGIGTTTPGALLDVTNNTNHLKYSPATAKLTLTGPASNLTVNPGLRLEFNSDPDAALSYFAYSHDNISQAYDAYWNGAAWVSSHLGANFAIYKNASQLTIGFNAGTPKGSTFPSFNTSTGVIFSNTGSMGVGGAPASAKLYVNGNVGIGTNNPTQELDVAGDIKASGSLIGATGSVTGNLTVDTTTLNVDAANNRVGVGTLTPALPLDVIGPINSSTGYHIGVARVFHITGTENTFVGIGPGAFNSGSENSFFGSFAGVINTTGTQNSFFGRNAGRYNTTGGSNSFFGRNAGEGNVTGIGNSFFGTDAGAANTASSNSFFGRAAGAANTSGSDNSFFGKEAGLANVTGTNNAFFGRSAGKANAANLNSFFGANAGMANTTGTVNAFFGYDAGLSNTDGSSNAFFGGSVGRYNTTGDDNTFIGSDAGQPNTIGSSNTFIGRSAGLANTIESNNTFVGANSNGAAGITNATAVGANAVVTQSDSLVLGNGVNVGIGPSAPAEKLHVRGNIYISGGGPFVNNYNGLILKSPNGLTCAKLTIDNAGALVTTVIPCP